MMDLGGHWSFDVHIRTGVCFGLNMLGRWGAGSFMHVKEMIEEKTTGQGNIRE
jgi:hypothetical protein